MTRSLALGEFPTSKGPDVPSRQLAEIRGYDSRNNSYTVRTRGVGGDPKEPGGRLLHGVPRKLENPGTVSPLEVGIIVILDMSLGFPFISGTLNIRAFRTDVG